MNLHTLKSFAFFVIFVLFSITILLQKCNYQENKHTETYVLDHHSYSKPWEIACKSLILNLKIDFEKKIFNAKASWKFYRFINTDTLFMDINRLKINTITDQNSKKLDYVISAHHPIFGSCLKIILDKNSNEVHIDYQTDSSAKAIQWMNALQTHHKTDPFVYTQSQAILARSWVPCQDAPQVKFTYKATIQTRSNYLALMSANNPKESNNKGEYHFVMDQAISSYLLALASGKLEFYDYGKQCGLYAEPSLMPMAKSEFVQLPDMMTSAEKLYGKYLWGRYDVLVLPTGFPFGGMENPKLTFATPSIISGDKSLVNLLAHELAHSWSGNLVTNQTWDDIWLNEGFTVYFEHRIMEAINGKDYVDMERVLGYGELKIFIDELKAENQSFDTKLKLNLIDRDPDEGLTDVPYIKGSLFLEAIEHAFGRTQFDVFLNAYFKTFSFKYSNTSNFEKFALTHFKNDDKMKQLIIEWIHSENLPLDFKAPYSKLLDSAQILAQKYINGQISISKIPYKTWSTFEKQHFFRSILGQKQINKQCLTDIVNNWNPAINDNAEIKCDWLCVCIEQDYQQEFDKLKQFTSTVGRRKFLLPIFNRLVASNRKQFAQELYLFSKHIYHPLTQNSIQEIVK